MPSYIYPDGVIGYSNFVNGADGTSNMQNDVDDPHGSVSTGDYVQNSLPNPPNIGDYIEWSLGNPSFTSMAAVELHIAHGDWSSVRTHNFDVQLRQGATVKKTWNLQTNVNTGTQENTSTLSAAEIATITDWNDVRLRVIHQSNSGTGPDPTVIFALHLALYQKHALASTASSSQANATSVGVKRCSVASSASTSQASGVSVGTRVLSGSGSSATSTDGISTGQWLHWSSKSYVDAVATGSVFSSSTTTHQLSASPSSSVDVISTGATFHTIESSASSNRVDVVSVGIPVRKFGTNSSSQLNSTTVAFIVQQIFGSLNSATVSLSDTIVSTLDSQLDCEVSAVFIFGINSTADATIDVDVSSDVVGKVLLVNTYLDPNRTFNVVDFDTFRNRGVSGVRVIVLKDYIKSIEDSMAPGEYLCGWSGNYFVATNRYGTNYKVDFSQIRGSSEDDSAILYLGN